MTGGYPPRHDAELLALLAEFRADFNAWSAAVNDLAADFTDFTRDRAEDDRMVAEWEAGE